MDLSIYKNIIVNVGLIVLFSYMLLRLRFASEFIRSDHKSLRDQLLMGLIFGIVGITSTYSGISVHGAIANTRVIGVVAGGLLGGPIVGLVAGLVAGLHRYAIDVGGFTALACAIATISEGMIGGAFSQYLKKEDNDSIVVFFVSVLAEVAQMSIILLVARPLSAAWILVEAIALPMIFFNSLGVVVLLSIVNSIVSEQDHNAAKQIQLAMKIADECLPYLRQGLYNTENLEQAIQVILRLSDTMGVVITDTKVILSHGGTALKGLTLPSGLPLIARDTIEFKRTQSQKEVIPSDAFYASLKSSIAVSAPLMQKGEVIGTLILFFHKFKLNKEVDYGFVMGLSKLFSTQLELAEVEIQIKLRQIAEFSALQSQINPHFLFNALSTITSFVREKPDRARELLIVLSSYFRNTLQDGHPLISLKQELSHVDNYLELEKARFEEKLQVEYDIPSGLDCMVPSFILQPIVENAVKHGAMGGKEIGYVHISAWQTVLETCISVRDNGKGIPKHIIENLNQGLRCGASVGLCNVQKRITSLYGETYRLLIWSTDKGTEITIRIPRDMEVGGVV